VSSIVSWVVDSSRHCTSSSSLSLIWVMWRSLRLVTLGACQYQDNLSYWRIGSWWSRECYLEAFCASLEACLSRDVEVHFIREDYSLSASRRTYTLWWGAPTSAGKSATNLILQEFGILLLISLLLCI
jgi:hypothetical protein